MVKRGAEKQITKDEIENEDDEERYGAVISGYGMQKASDEQLAQRRIVHAARTHDGRPDFSKKKAANPFANLVLVAPAANNNKDTTASVTNNTTTTTNNNATIASETKEEEVKKAATVDTAKEVTAVEKVTTVSEAKHETKGATGALQPETESTTEPMPSSAPNKKAKTESIFGNSSAFAGGFASATSSASGFAGATSGFGFAAAATTTAFGFATSKGFGEVKGTGFNVAFNNTSTVPSSSSVEPTTTTGTSTTNEPFAFAPSKEQDPSSAAPIAQQALLPEQYKLSTGEEDDLVLAEARCKTHRWAPTKCVVVPEERKQQVPSVAPSAAFTTKESDGNATSNDTAKGTKDDSNNNVATDNKSTNNDSTTTASSSPSTCTWHEVGTGPLKFLKSLADGRLRIVQRRESTPHGNATTVILNLPIWKETVVDLPSDKHVKLMSVASAKETWTVLCKFKLADEAATMTTSLRKEIAACAHSCYGPNKKDENDKE
jgi:hypothetical protein